MKEWPQRKWTTGSSRGWPVAEHLQGVGGGGEGGRGRGKLVLGVLLTTL